MIEKDAKESEIIEFGLRPFAKATAFVLEYEKENYSGPNLSKGSVYLFGGNEASILEVENSAANRAAPGGNCGESRNCRWFQLGCHLHNVGVWICNHQGLLPGIYYGLSAIAVIVKHFL